MPVQPVTSGSGTTSAQTEAMSSSNPTLSATDFMKLLSTQMENQDPLQPMDPSQSMTQLAQFSSLQQMTTLSQNQSLATANSYLGAQVTVTQGSGASATSVTGLVQSIAVSNGAPQLVINGTAYDLSAVTAVQLPAAASSSSSNSSSSGSSSGS